MMRLLQSSKKSIIISAIFFNLVFFYPFHLLRAAPIPTKSSLTIADSGIGVMTKHLIYNDDVITDDILQKYQAAGIKWCRMIVEWPYFEKTPGVYQEAELAILQANIEKLVAAGIQPYFCLGKENTIYSSDSPTPQDTVYFNAWLTFVTMMVNRFKPWVQYYEIWNEPNIPQGWLPEPNPSDYTDLVIQTSQTILQNQPAAKIIACATALIDINFIQTCFENGIASHIHYVSIHPYRPIPEQSQSLVNNFSPNSSFISITGGFAEEITQLRSVIEPYSDSIELWNSEIATISDEHNAVKASLWDIDYHSEKTQAKYLLRTYLINLGLSIKQTTWTLMHEYHSLRENNESAQWFDNYLDRTYHDDAFATGLIRTPPFSTVHEIEAEAYSTITAPMTNGGSYLYNAATDVDTSGYASYQSLTLSTEGTYMIWGRFIEDYNATYDAFLVQMNSDPIYTFMVSAEPEVNKWIGVWGKDAPYLYQLAPGQHTCNIFTYSPATQLDQVRVVQVDPACEVKPAYQALQNLCSFFDNQLNVDSSLEIEYVNQTVPAETWQHLHHYTFYNESENAYYLAYWLGIEAVESYPAQHITLRISHLAPTQLDQLDLLAGTQTTLSQIEQDSDFFQLSNLPIKDYPQIIKLSLSPVSELSPPKLIAFPNPSKNKLYLDWSGYGLGTIAVKLYNSAGECVLKANSSHEGNRFYIDVSNCPPGVYFLRSQLTIQGTTHDLDTKKIAIQK